MLPVRRLDVRGSGILAVEQLPDARDHLCAVESDRGHDLLMGEPGHAELEVEPAGSEVAQVRDDLLRDGLRSSDVERAVGADVVGERFLRRGREAALPGDPSQRQTPLRPELTLSLLVRFGDVAGSVDADRPPGVSELPQGLLKEVGEGGERAGEPPMIASISEKP